MTAELIADLDAPRPALPRAGLRARLSALLALRHPAALLREVELVRAHLRGPRGAARQQRADRLASRAHQARPLRQMAREQRRLGPVPRPLLGHAAADLGVRGGGLRRPLLRRLGRRAARARPRRGPRGPAPPPHRRGRPRLRGVRGRDAPGRVGDRHLVRQRRDALRAVPLPVRERGAVRGALPSRLHLRGDRPDPRLVLHAARRVDAALRRNQLSQLRLPRPDPRSRGPEDVEEQGQRGRALGRDLRPRRRRLPLVLPDRPAALVRLPILRRHGRRIGPPVPPHPLEHLFLLGPLRQRRGTQSPRLRDPFRPGFAGHPRTRERRRNEI